MFWLIQTGIAFDMLLNAMLGGVAGQTISLRAALAMKAGKPWGCVVCRFLSWLVQRDHCQDQLAGGQMTDVQYFRAFVGLAVLGTILLSPLIFIAARALSALRSF